MKLLFIFLLLLLNILQILCFQNYSGFRQRRQVDGSSNGSQIDLNITVPYIFSARLYPYGTSKDDKIVQVDPTAFNLQTPLKLLDHTYNSLFVHKDGFISLSGDDGNGPVPLIAVYWTKIKTGKVYFRESFDQTILNVAQNEVNIQYRYGSEFRPTSVAIITWETSDGNTDGNVFQLALILGDSGCFAHIVYSKLTSNSDAVAGFTSDDETSTYFALPGSGTPAAIQLVEKSNIGIPGEWLFRIDSEQIYLCGAGFQGLECVDSCLPTQWYLDCSKQCHCADGNPCNTETGECPDAKCNPGWTGAPICNEDIDECAENANLCPTEQPDCVNTPGAYLCLCFEYDNSTNSCLGNADRGHPEAGKSATIVVPIMELNPKLPQRIQETTQKATTRRIRPTFAFLETEFFTTTTPTTTTSPATTTTRISLTTRARPLTFEVTPLSPKQKLFNECSNCATQSTCINGRCQCNIGWKGNGKVCEDVDECSNPLTCGEHAICQNTLGSYQCVCNVGFIATSTGCKDVDECAEETVTCKGGNTTQCINTIGGYECRCKDGYTGDPENGCRDINECEKSDFFCGSKATCVNEVGGYRCECLEGYEKLGSVCTDINECLHNPCDSAALCTNVEGTFKCDCIDGFVGNGIECHETILFPTNGASPISNAPVALDTPLTIFGSKYEKLYVSDNGVISFDRSFYGPISDISEIRSTALFPFYRQSSPASSVTFIEISESDASRYSLLTRASLTAQNKFKQTDFRAKTLYITTFNDDNGFAYQVVIAQSKNATYVTFLYEKIENTNGATAGISSNNGFFNIPTELLSHNSNIGQRGKWTYRVDRASGLIPCPAGALGAPLCQQDCPAGTWGFECINKCHCADNVPCDFGTGYCANSRCAPGFRGVNCYEDINECVEGVARCHHDAKCLNIPGGYECKCNNNFIGDGFSCVELDKCQLKFGQPCSPQGYCQTSTPDEPYCTCNPGYIGDGNTCTRQEETTKIAEKIETSTVYTTWPTKTTGRIFVEPAISESRSTEAVDEHPFVMNNWISAEVTAPPVPSPTTAASRPIITLTARPKSPIQPKDPIGNEYTDIDNSVVEEATIEGDDDNYFTAVVILLPAALFVIWFILLIALGVYCCKRRQTARRNKNHLEMMGWSRQDYTSPRSSNFSHFAYT